MRPTPGTFNDHPQLVNLPPLVRKQRRLEARISAVAEDVKQEKSVREVIDALLIAAGLKKGELVTCAGYDVIHNERAGQSSINQDALVEQLVAGGVDRAFVLQAIADCTVDGKPAKFATVRPSKGTKVRTEKLAA